ncbi:MAG: hypothetical protein KBA31_15565 [Alphaproteobacteria bacterium]|nr:hypothetical protein [Alphaproteobacteria bacterium]
MPQRVRSRLSDLGLIVRAVPVFDLRKVTASTFFCIPARVTSSGNAFGYHLLSGALESTLAAVDLELVDGAIGYAARFDQAKIIAAIGTTVSYATLADPQTRAAYLAKLKTASFPNNPLVLKVESIPAGTPADRLSTIMGYVKAGGWRAFMSVSDFRGRTWTPGSVSAVSGIGTMLEPTDEAVTVRQKAQSLLALCAAQGAVSFMDGLVLKEAVEAAVAEGIRFGTGPGLSLSVFPMNGGLPKVPLPARS